VKPQGSYGAGSHIDEEEAAAAAAERAVACFTAAALSGLYEGTIRYRSSKPESKVGRAALNFSFSFSTASACIMR
jgi:hypothetical protein